MSEALIRGIHINYEIVGNSGPWVALTPGSRRSYQELIGIARDIAASGYRVLLHDRRNCGASDVAFDRSASEHEVWADDLYYLQLLPFSDRATSLAGSKFVMSLTCQFGRWTRYTFAHFRS
jgi:pimeloyl-ACP methyl ester carboxylesterase